MHCLFRYSCFHKSPLLNSIMLSFSKLCSYQQTEFESSPSNLSVPQVAMRGHVHVARVDVVVQDVLVNMVPFQEAASSRAGVRMSFAELLPDDGREKLSVDQFVRPDRDSPCMTMVNTALTWFGSMCLSACHPDDSNKALKCPIPFPTDGAYAQISIHGCDSHYLQA